MVNFIKIVKVAVLVILLGSSYGYARQRQGLYTIADSVVSGKVISASDKQPLEGIKIAYLDLYSAITDDKGNFRIKVPGYGIVISISGPGYISKQVALKGHSELNVELYEDGFRPAFDQTAVEGPLRPVAGRGIGAQNSTRTYGGWQAGTESPDSYLQGRFAGLNVTRRSGTPGIGAAMLLRGVTSLYTGNKPLIVLDGIIYDNESYGSSLIKGHEYNPLQSIDVKDIESVDIVKDGLTNYGTRAANGILFINTTRAKELATKIDFAAYGGLNFSPSAIPLLNSGDYRTYLSDLLNSGGYTNSQLQGISYLNDDVSNPEYNLYHHHTNWQNKVFKTGSSQNYFLKITGGDNIARYALSGGFLDNQGITDNTDLTRYNTRFNADLNLTKKLTARIDLAFTFNQQNLKDQGIAVKTNPISLAQVKAPFLSANEVSLSGAISPNLAGYDIFNVSNPLALVENSVQTNQNYRFNSQVSVNYQFNPAYSLSSAIGITYDKVRENSFIPAGGVVPDTLSNSLATSRLGSRVQKVFILNNDTRLSYHKVFDRVHSLSVHLGGRFNTSRAEDDYALGYNSSTDDLVSVGTGVGSLRRVGGDIGKWRWLNTYLSTEYALLSRYLFSASLSADGSSRFGTEIENAPEIGGTRLALLPSASVAWVLSSERFLANAGFLELLKLRASYGVTGNDNIGNYNNRNYYISQNLLGMEGLVPANIANQAIRWETVKKANVGLDASFFKDRLSLSVDLYTNKTSHMLTYEQANAAAGLEAIISNEGALTTRGADLSISARIINKAVKWDAGVQLSAYRSEIDALPGNSLLTSYAGGTYITATGQGPNLFYGYKTNGVYVSDAEAAAGGLSSVGTNGVSQAFRGGDVRFADHNNDGIIDENDRVVIGDPNPDFTGGFSNTLSWKKWTLDALFTFSSGNDIYNYSRSQLESLGNFNNQTQAVNNRWRADGQVTSTPRAALGDPAGNSRFSDRWIEDGSYLRLKSLSLSYTIPGKGKFLKYTRIYGTASNLFTFTKYLGYDPEFSAAGNVFTAGTDVNLEPLYRSVQLGFRIGL